MRWVFEEDPLEIEGFNHEGITHYTDNRAGALFRECLQNSIDAAAGDKPVEVFIEKKSIPVAAFAGPDLAAHVDATAVFVDNPAAAESLREAAKRLRARRGDSTCLLIRDRNTTGTLPNGPKSPWVALTKGGGLSVKADDKAMGSFGIGKNAPFAYTPFRTVLYMTCWQENGNGQRQLMTGRSILTTHAINEVTYGAKGHLVRNVAGREDLDGTNIPDEFRRELDEPSTLVVIPGYKSDTDPDQWLQAVRTSIIENFFYAIIESKLQVIVISDREDLIDADALRPPLDGNFGDETKRYIDLCRGSIARRIESTTIDGVGDVKLLMSVGDDEPAARSLALVRAPGLMLTDKKSNLGPAGRRPFPRAWDKFTAVVVVAPRSADDWVVRACENPAHDSLSADQIVHKRSAEDLQTAKSRLKELGDWIHEMIGRQAGSGTAYTTADSRILHDSGLTVIRESGSRGTQIKEGKVPRSVVRQPKSPDNEDPDLDPNGDSEIPGPVPGPGLGPTPLPPAPPPSPPPIPPPPPDPRPSKRRPRHNMRTLFAPSGNPNEVLVSFACPPADEGAVRFELRSVGEDGSGERVPVRKAAREAAQDQAPLEDWTQEGRIIVPAIALNSADRLTLRLTISGTVENRRFVLAMGGPA